MTLNVFKYLTALKRATLLLTILTFRFEDDKARAYRGREELRKQGIRIGDDLTRTQRNTLSSLREHGKFGYFYKGQLHVKDTLQQPTSQRRTVTGRRKAPPTLFCLLNGFKVKVDTALSLTHDTRMTMTDDGNRLTRIQIITFKSLPKGQVFQKSIMSHVYILTNNINVMKFIF